MMTSALEQADDRIHQDGDGQYLESPGRASGTDGETTNMFIEITPWIPEEGKKALREWDKTCRKGLEDLTAAMNENHKKVDEFFAGSYGTLQGDIFTSTAK